MNSFTPLMKLTFTPENFDEIEFNYECKAYDIHNNGRHSEPINVTVDPSFFACAGIPICAECGNDMELVSIKVTVP